jgi:maltose alpha-D-glucosyltransferase/alpha-amylase
VLDRMRLLGTRTAELHRVLASSDDPLFAPEPYDIMHQQSIYGSAVAHAARTFDLLRARRGKLPAELVPLADDALAREAQLDRALAQVTHRRIDVVRTRLHGDYHLGQVLWTGDDFVIIDFEGEPGRPLSQRRFKRAALRDVAGMIRSLHYASAAALRNGKHRPEDRAILAPWSRAWSEWMSAAFLAGYLEVVQGSRVIPSKEPDLQLLLDFFLLEKCVYEIGYELDNRPDWVEIPLRGLLALLPGPA